MHVAFTDESGMPSPKAIGRYFVVAVLVAKTSRAIELHVRRARRSLRRRKRTSELKAAQSEPRVIRRLLEAIADEPCEIYAVVVDKQGAQEELAEMVYRRTVARAIAHAVERHPRLHVYIDKRYTNPHQRLKLEETIREAIAHVPGQVVIIEQVESIAQPGLQAVDFVAWALARKHGSEPEEEWANIIAERVVIAETVKATKIAALPGGR